MHSYTFQPRAPPVRTGTADAERRLGRPRMVCGKGAGVPLGIGSRFGWAAGFAPRQPRAAAGGKFRV